jgi:hypothetical protein
MKQLILMMIIIGSFFWITPRVYAASVSWDGGGDGSSWSNATNWSNDQIPSAADDVTIDPTGTVNISVGTTIHSLTCTIDPDIKPTPT